MIRFDPFTEATPLPVPGQAHESLVLDFKARISRVIDVLEEPVGVTGTAAIWDRVRSGFAPRPGERRQSDR